MTPYSGLSITSHTVSAKKKQMLQLIGVSWWALALIKPEG